MSERVIQREGRWKSDAYIIRCTPEKNADDAGDVSRKLVTGKDLLYGVNCRNLGVASVVGGVQWLWTIGCLSHPRIRTVEPRQ